MTADTLRLCTHEGCEFYGKHYENCPRCFGFGMEVVNGNLSPLTAAEAATAQHWVKCPVCAGTAAWGGEVGDDCCCAKTAGT